MENQSNISQNKVNRFYPLLWLTALIWGFAFVAQRKGMEYIGPYSFNGIRFALGSLSLLPVIYYFNKKKSKQTKTGSKNLFKGGIAAGLVLFAAASLQQAGIVYTSAGKAGFITGLYVVLVPVIGFFLGQRVTNRIVSGAILTIVGLFLLMVRFPLSFGKGDLLVLASAFFWAAHVQLINRLARKHSPLLLSAIQFAVCSFASLIVASIQEPIVIPSIMHAAVPLLYGGLMSVGVAYTLQVVVQKHVNPNVTAIVLSFETVFAAIGGWIFLGESLSSRNIAGCLIMLAGIMIVQLRPEQ
jgi:drug/metabolite transporter (DMT)-like permease